MYIATTVKRAIHDRGANVSITYFIQGRLTKRIKIGTSQTLLSAVRRIHRFQVGSPDDLRVIGATDTVTEHAAHGDFADYWLHGEWFEPSARLVEYVRQFAKTSEAQFLREKLKVLRKRGRAMSRAAMGVRRVYRQGYGNVPPPRQLSAPRPRGSGTLIPPKIGVTKFWRVQICKAGKLIRRSTKIRGTLKRGQLPFLPESWTNLPAARIFLRKFVRQMRPDI